MLTPAALMIGLKKGMPSERSNDIIRKSMPMNCVAVSWIKLVASTAQQKIGMRKSVMPLGRISMIVAIRFSEPRIEERPMPKTART